ncbi:probable E3 ubiquitin-protein ligase RHY1A [Argentina anserina]|uniref:probable E3 ubiquitin-protein ligase RHY1A n=1 Tax=Argentina anserina TaxID=57926 RepID=UPI0021767C52|nr:probable E3 ubiquitin-protein ligase RHY1A [Potentilla anserina]
MTSASELFYNRRSRYNSRATHSDLGFDSLCPPDRIYNRRRHNHHDSSAACDVLLRRPSRHRVSPAGRAAGIGPEQGGQSGAGDRVGPRVSGNERLPGAVVLARERLLERLRGMPPSETRRRRALHMYRSGLIGDDLAFVDERDWSTDSWPGRSASGSMSNDLSSQIARMHLLEEANKKPPGLTEDVLDCLGVEPFSDTELGVDGVLSKALRDCSICLESFMNGDELICLPCAHRFHATCLGPWVRIRGDCPYCRRAIVVDCDMSKTNT